MPLLLIGVPFALAATGFFIDKAGEGINDASSGILKIGVGAVAGYVILKKTGVL